MGLFSSDYEANGSTSISQLGQQRHHDDTYIGDLIISNLYTEKNIAANIRDEITIGTTAFVRRYHRKGYDEGFKSTLSYDGTTEENIELLPVVSIKDAGNAESVGSFMGFHPMEIPYYKNPDTSEMLKKRIRVIDNLGADFVELSKGIFEPTPVPVFESAEWNRDFGRMYKDAVKLCAKNKAPDDIKEICKHATEKDYYDDMVDNQEKQKKSTDDITDVNVGFFVGMKTLDQANASALFMTLQPLMNNLKRSNDFQVGTPEWMRATMQATYGVSGPDKTFSWKLTAGSLIITYSMADYSYVRRQGTVKYGWETGLKRRKKKASWKIVTFDELTNDDPIIDVIVESSMQQIKDEEIAEQGQQDQDQSDWEADNPGQDYDDSGDWGTYDQGSDMVLELRMQDLPDALGNPTYLEMRLIGLAAEHTVSVLRDTEHGKGFTVAVRGTLQDYDSEEYEDIIIFPISKYAFDEMPTFMRERFTREALCMIVDGVTVQEVKWYQKGWFKIFMFIVAVVLSVFTSGQSFTVYNLMMAAIKMAITAVVATYIMSLIENPMLAALLIVVIAVFTGTVKFDNLLSMATLAVEATGTYIQKQFAQEMLKLQQEAEDLQKDINKAKKEMEEIEEATGLNKKDDSAMMLWLATLPPTDEDADGWYNRVLNTDLNQIDLGTKLQLELE